MDTLTTETVLTFNPGDRVLVSLDTTNLAQDQAVQMRELLEERFPGVHFTVMPRATFYVYPEGT